MSLLAFVFSIVCSLIEAGGGNAVGFEMDVRMGLDEAFPGMFVHHRTEQELRELRQKLVEVRRQRDRLEAKLRHLRRQSHHQAMQSLGGVVVE